MMFSPASNQQYQRRGGSSYSNASLPSGNTDVVTAAANTNGLIVRTALLQSIGPGTTTLWDGNLAYFLIALINQAISYTGNGILIPPGSPLRVTSNGGGGSVWITWDVL
jgi:hypothetical protein